MGGCLARGEERPVPEATSKCFVALASRLRMKSAMSTAATAHIGVGRSQEEHLDLEIVQSRTLRAQPPVRLVVKVLQVVIRIPLRIGEVTLAQFLPILRVSSFHDARWSPSLSANALTATGFHCDAGAVVGSISYGNLYTPLHVLRLTLEHVQDGPHVLFQKRAHSRARVSDMSFPSIVFLTIGLAPSLSPSSFITTLATAEPIATTSRSLPSVSRETAAGSGPRRTQKRNPAEDAYAVLVAAFFASSGTSVSARARSSSRARSSGDTVSDEDVDAFIARVLLVAVRARSFHRARSRDIARGRARESWERARSCERADGVARGRRRRRRVAECAFESRGTGWANGYDVHGVWDSVLSHDSSNRVHATIRDDVVANATTTRRRSEG